MRWDEKRYHSVDYECKHNYGEKLYKITLNGGLTCPNRDGTVGTGGCIFCSSKGSGDFAGLAQEPISLQLQKGKEALRKKRPIQSFIAYFQAFTNTYGPIEHLRKIYMEAAADPDVKVISIATRPDCLGSSVLELLNEVNRIKPVWVELGLQTIHESSARYIRRGYELPVFERAVKALRKIGITVIVHMILYLPGEGKEEMQETLQYLNRSDVQGVKLQLLHVLRGTDLAVEYEKNPFYIPSMEEYIEMLESCICLLRPDMVIHRLTGDGPKELLIEPKWSSGKRTILNTLQHHLKEKDIWQGKDYCEGK